jgi:hypothetical protein
MSLNVVAVRAALPLAQHDPEATLKNTTEVTFDPLAVAAILHNPRANVSAARLYTQYDRPIFTWPHTMMIGATLTPVKLLVEHLTATFSSIHPAITLCTQDTVNLPVVSNMVFKEFPLNFSNMWLDDIIAFKSSKKPANDFMLVHITDTDTVTKAQPPPSTKLLGRLVLDLIATLTGLILVVGIVFAVLTADVWALTLFFFYGTHWAASLAISSQSLVQVHSPEIPVKTDATTRYAIYQRPAGGTVVFKGRQDAMEKWARMTWEFKRSLTNNVLHWFWVLSGTFAAISSVACMVNMRGYMQLAFLAELVYSSLAEILATRVTRILQGETKGSDGSYPVRNNSSRTQGIIRATVEASPKFRLVRLDWVDLKRLPDQPVFRNMQGMLESINAYQARVEEADEPVPDLENTANPTIEKAISGFRHVPVDDPALAQRIIDETWQALKQWNRKVHSSSSKIEDENSPSPPV